LLALEAGGGRFRFCPLVDRAVTPTWSAVHGLVYSNMLELIGLRAIGSAEMLHVLQRHHQPAPSAHHRNHHSSDTHWWGDRDKVSESASETKSSVTNTTATKEHQQKKKLSPQG
jgi:hypothetical protein